MEGGLTRYQIMKIKREQIEELVDEPYFSRGEKYWLDGKVQLLTNSQGKVTAKAVGSEVYNVEITLKGGILNGHCACPAYESLGPCKHIAATCLAALEQDEDGGYQTSADTLDRIDALLSFEKKLNKLSKKHLISIVLRLRDFYPDLIYEIDDDYYE
jgi:uncharacterized Zn finger protein